MGGGADEKMYAVPHFYIRLCNKHVVVIQNRIFIGYLLTHSSDLNNDSSSALSAWLRKKLETDFNVSIPKYIRNILG